ncbi:MAG: elongation factor G [Acidobacteriota bacterium]
MPKKPIQKLRNIGIIAHIDAGKTTTTERFLYYSGESYRIGEVHDGQAIMDFRDDEKERGITISSAATTFYWNDCQINLIDTPGHVDFTAEVERSLRVLDGAIVIFDGVEGVEPQSETVWHQADKYQVPRICYINKMDRIGAHFYATMQEIHDKLGGGAIAIQIPAGQGDTFFGIIDLLDMKLYTYDRESLGKNFGSGPIPGDLKGKALEYRKILLEATADLSDAIAEKYLDGKNIERNEIIEPLRAGTISRKLTPVLCGAALKNIGVQKVLDAVCDFLPSPIDIPIIKGEDPENKKEKVRKPLVDEPFSALLFKIVATSAAELAYLRVYSGHARVGDWVYNPRKRQKERIRRILQMHADKGVQVESMEAGDIVATTSLKWSVTGDTLTDENNRIIYEPIHFPDTVVSVSIEPKTSADKDKLAEILKKLEKEDPTFKQKIDPDTGQLIISGMGELHIDVLKNRMLREFNLDAYFGKPRVSYKETAAGSAEGIGEFSKVIGGQNVFGKVTLGLEYHRGDTKVDVVSRIREVEVPSIYIPDMLDTVANSAEGGGIYGYPVIHIRVTLLEGRFNDPVTATITLNAAANLAFRDALKKAGSRVLEPYMKLEVRTPEEFLGPICKNLNSKRALIEDTKIVKKIAIVKGVVPLSEMFGYSTIVRSISQGRASFNMEPLDYRPVPDNLVQLFHQKI